MSQNQINLNQLERIFDVNSKIATDSLGYLWITDQDGLYKYDGYEFKLLSYNKIFGSAFKSKSVTLFAKDNRSNFWIATENGELIQMSPRGKTINYSKSLQGTALRCAASTKDLMFFGSASGEIWTFNFQNNSIKKQLKLESENGKGIEILDMVVSENNNLYISNTENEVYEYALFQNRLKKLKLPLRPNRVDGLFMVTDHRNRLWVATEYQGLLCYDPLLGTTQLFGERGDQNNEFMMYRTIFCDREGIIWLGTDGYGLRRLDPKNGKITAFKNQIGNKYSLSNNTVRYINGDDNGNIWIILKGGIVHTLSHAQYPLRTYSGLPDHLPHRILSILKSKDKSVWIGTDGEGLSHVSPDGSREHFGIGHGASGHFQGRFIQALAEDRKGNIWIGTYQNGLFRYLKEARSFEQVPVASLSRSIPLKDFRNIFIDSKNRVWASSTYGLHVFDENITLLATFPYGIKGVDGPISDAVFEDKRGQIWIAFSKGTLYKFKENSADINKSIFQEVTFHKWENKALRYYSISQVVQDKRENFWFRCDGGFIIRFDPVNLSYESYENHEELKHIDIMSILIDRDGLLWLGSRNGLHHFDPVKKTRYNFTMYDGLQDNLFIRKSAFQANDEELFFGGNNGITSFYPKSLSHKTQYTNLMINGIQVLNKSLEDLIPKYQHERIEYLNELELKAHQSSFSISFAAIGNLLNTNYRYQYRLKGFEEQYSDPGKARMATYTNLPAGNYTFEVVAAQQGSEVFDIGPATFDIYIAPYWWQSIPAKIIYVLIFCGIAYLLWRWILLRSKLHWDQIDRLQEQELYRMKINFFAKISHELQTPLSLIIGPLETLFSKTDQEEQHDNKQLYLIKNNAERLSRIVTELTHVRDNEIGKLKLKKQESDLTTHIKSIVLSFEELATHKGIDFLNDLSEESFVMYYDYLKIEHVIYNLLGNAIKFTPSGGSVQLELFKDEYANKIIINVKDTGPGIDPETAHNVFQLFYQGNMGKEAGGLGIGLALSKEIIQLHEGKLILESNIGGGSCFKIELPLDGHYLEEQIIVSEGSNIDVIKVKQENQRIIIDADILIVEDNLDMQLFLSELLKERFRIKVVSNGVEASVHLNQNHVDLILSDIMMPEMDGLQLAELVHNNLEKTHIPFILLTAYPSVGNRLKGLKSGVVSFLSKPFHPEELLQLIENILTKHQHAISQFRNKMTSMPVVEEGKVPKSDSFLMKLTAVLKDKVSDPNFLLEDLEGLLNMSYSVIFKKCQEITGLTPSEYYRRIKLKKAAVLLVTYNYTVSEAAYAVGFTDSKYFSRLFKESFGKTPSVFKNLISAQDLESFLQQF